jgi:hypothetical protein
MENKKINITELLKDCPPGMKLYSPIFGDVYLDKIRPHLGIVVTTDKEQGDFKEEFLYDGRYGMNGECMLFPSKDKTTWEGFEPPCEFKDGDIIFTCALFSGICSDYLITGLYYTWISIFHKMHKDQVITYVDIENSGRYFPFWMRKGELCRKDDITYQRLATEEEKERLFKYIKDNGYKWNAETKTLEKLVELKFKVGDVVQDKDGYKAEITEINIGDECYEYISKLLNWKGGIPFKDQDKWELVPDEIEPKFKVGDRIKHKQCFISGIITNIDDDCYKIKYDSGAVSLANIKYQDDWKSGCGVTFDLRFSEQDKKQELVPDKFDISTLVPFESRVLVRHTKDEIWKPAIFGCYNGYRYYVLGNVHWVYCIPYEGNEHLCGKTDDCDEYYKTWED